MTEQLPLTDEAVLSQTTLPHQDGGPLGPTHNVSGVPTRYSIEMLADGAERSPVPAREALSLDPTVRAQQFAAAYAGGAISTEIVKDAWTGVLRGGKPGFVVFFKVTESDVDALGVPRELFVDGKFQHPGTDERQKLVEKGDEAELTDFDARQKLAEKLDNSITPEQRQPQVADYYDKQAYAVERLYKDDLAGVENKEVGLESLHQAFELADSVEGAAVGGIRVLNFTETQMTGEHVADIAAALRYFSERTGGAIYDKFDNIVFVPKDHPSLKVPIRQKDGSTKIMTRRGYMAPRTLVMSEWSLYPPEEQPPATVEGTAFFHSYLRPNEPAEGPGSPVMTVAQGRFGATVAHEMTHMALFERGIPVSRSLYSRFNPTEHDAELGAAQFLGEDHLVPASEDELRAFEFKWEWLRSKGAKDGRPQGEHFVAARQHDLTEGPLPRRLQYPNQPLSTEVTYRLVAAV
jgi:hypothetical protein